MEQSKIIDTLETYQPPHRETALHLAGRVPLELGQNSRAAATAVDASVAPAATA